MKYRYCYDVSYMKLKIEIEIELFMLDTQANTEPVLVPGLETKWSRVASNLYVFNSITLKDLHILKLNKKPQTSE